MSGQDFSDLAQAIGMEVDDGVSVWVDEEGEDVSHK